MRKILLAIALIAITFAAWAATAWNTPGAGNCAANVVISGLQIGPDSTTATGACRGTTSHASGKYYFEYTLNAPASGASLAVGVGSASASLAVFVGSDNNAVGCLINSGALKLNNVNLATGVNCGGSSTDVLEIAVDLTNKRLWMRKKGTNWNGNVANDPNTPATGADISTMASFTVFPMWSANSTSDTGTANFGGTTFSDTIPPNYLSWDSAAGGGSSPSRMPALGVGQNDEPVNDNLRYARAAGE